VEADQGQIDQVLVNLYLNAWQAMSDDITLNLSTSNVILDEAYTNAFKVKPGPYVCIKVTDRGKGIPAENMKRIFEPFFTTKKMGRGTGLGLASAFGIIKNHGGIIDVKSELGRGTTFSVYLPAVTRVLEKNPLPASPKQQRASGTLLVVDDEPYILNTLADILQDMGYSVISANSGLQAIERFKESCTEIDGVLLDMVMPDLNGRQVLVQLRKIQPTIKVILSSGYSLNGLSESDLEASGDKFIQKPYQIEQLATMLAEVLSDGTSSESDAKEMN